MTWVEQQIPRLVNFEIRELKHQSQALKKNPLKDPTLRYHPVLVPKEEILNAPVVLILAGFTGNGPKYLGARSFEKNFAQQIDQAYQQEQAPHAYYIFVDAFSFWGGSQFVNSKAVGNYEDFIKDELYQLIRKHVSRGPIAIFGASSGGYGALHLCSKYPKKFPYLGALAPDAFFEANYLPDLYQSSPFLEGKSFKYLKNLHLEGRLLNRKNGHALINSIGMSACYSPQGEKGEFHYPIDLATGLIRNNIWKKWKDKDPVVFLGKRTQKLKQLKGVFLEVGKRDEFSLQMGSRQIQTMLKKHKVKHHYEEFEGGHFDTSERRPSFLMWLQKNL